MTIIWQAIRTSRSFDPANPNADLDEQELIRIAKYMSETKGNLAWLMSPRPLITVNLYVLDGV